MKRITGALISFLAMAAAIAHQNLQSSHPESSSNTSSSTVNPPAPSLTSHDFILPSPESLNQTIQFSPRDINERDRADEFTCTGVEYFEPDIEIDCVVDRRTTEKHWNYKFDIKISPAGLAYSQVGLNRWHAHFQKTFVDQWDSEALGDMPQDGKWYESFTADTWTENNWGTGMRIQSSETSLRRLKAKVWGPDEERDDPRFEKHLAEYLEKLIPKVVCEDDAESINWEREAKCGVRKGVDFVDKDDKDKNEDDRKDDRGNGNSQGPDSRPQGGYRGRDP